MQQPTVVAACCSMLQVQCVQQPGVVAMRCVCVASAMCTAARAESVQHVGRYSVLQDSFRKMRYSVDISTMWGHFEGQPQMRPVFSWGVCLCLCVCIECDVQFENAWQKHDGKSPVLWGSADLSLSLSRTHSHTSTHFAKTWRKEHCCGALLIFHSRSRALTHTHTITHTSQNHHLLKLIF